MSGNGRLNCGELSGGCGELPGQLPVSGSLKVAESGRLFLVGAPPDLKGISSGPQAFH